MASGGPLGPRGCGGHSKRTGQLCGAPAVKGTDRCPVHGGKSLKQLKAEGQVRAEVMSWGLDSPTVDPGETLLRLVSQSARRADWLAGKLAEQTEEYAAEGDGSGFALHGIPPGLRALIGHKYDLTRDGEAVPVEEAIRGLAQLEAQERDRCARFAKLALDAGIAERTVRIAEQQGALIAGVLQRVLDALELSPAQRELVAVVAPRELRAIGAGVA